MPRPIGPAGRLRKVTVGFPEDVLEELGDAARPEIRRIVTEHVRSRRAPVEVRDPETGGAETEPAVQ